MRMILVVAFVTFGLGSVALAQQYGRLPAPPRAATLASPNDGAARGYVFWPVNAAQYNNAAPCQGLTIRATVRGDSGQVLPTENNLTSFGNVDGYIVCAYTLQHLPEREDLRVYATVDPSAFTPHLIFGPVPADSQNQKWYVNIPGGQCNQLVPATPTASVLLAASWTCGDFANNVNFTPTSSVNSRGIAPEPVLARPLSPQGSGGSGSTGTLLAPGSQQTLLGGGSAQPPPAPVPSKGNGRNEYEAITAQRGVTQDPGFSNWANSGQAGNGLPNGTSRTGTSLSKIEHAPLNSINDVAMLCAKDPSFRVLGISGASGGNVTITVDRQYTIWGCSFGTPPPVKAPSPAGPQVQNRTVMQANANGNTNAITIYSAPPPDHIAWFVFPKIDSWSNNAIVVTVSEQQGTHPGSPTGGLPVAAELWLTRGDGQTTIYGHEGGFYFKPAN
jgi:hypothetical protein